MNENESDLEEQPMEHREITLDDGRYMIFYTFDDEADDADPSSGPTQNNV